MHADQNDTLQAQRALIDTLALCLQTTTQAPVQRFETHISIVLVAPPFAYKFKKALRLPYLDYATLAARRHYCEEECRINRRLAPELYLGVAAVTGSAAAPMLVDSIDDIDDAREPIREVAVRMHSFAQADLWSARAAHGTLTAADSAALARQLVAFHAKAEVSPAASGFGLPQAIQATVTASLDELHALLRNSIDDSVDASIDAARAQLATVRAWQAEQASRLAFHMQERKREGRIRECHGDLHCDNLLTQAGAVQAFDAIEFDPTLRWIDVMSDVAFVTMDLQVRGQARLAADLLSRYLESSGESSGDYGGLLVLRHYQIQHALVRAKVLLMRARQLAAQQPAQLPTPQPAQQPSRETSEPASPLRSADLDKADASRDAGLRYLAHAAGLTQPAGPVLCITHGLSGSGKTSFARLAVQAMGAIQLRSDVERKRLHGIAPERHESDANVLYGVAASNATYRRLAELAREVLQVGWPVIVDAAFLKAAQRARFRQLAATLHVPFYLFDLQTEVALLQQRLQARQVGGKDASDAGWSVLAWQRQHQEPLALPELAYTIPVDMREQLEAEEVADLCKPVLQATLPAANLR